MSNWTPTAPPPASLPNPHPHTPRQNPNPDVAPTIPARPGEEHMPPLEIARPKPERR